MATITENPYNVGSTALSITSKRCSYCRNTVSKVYWCAYCHFERYCGKQCQERHWSTHQVVCKLIRQQSQDWKIRNPDSIPSSEWKREYDDVFPLLRSEYDSYEHKKFAIDIGCGFGCSSIHLLKRGWKVIAIDYYKEPLIGLQKKADEINSQWIKTGQLVILKSNIHEYSFPKKEVDLVVAADVFPYLDPFKLGNLWNKIYNSLKSNGVLLGSFFMEGSPCVRYGAWVVEDISSVESILQKGPYEQQICRRRTTYRSFIIEFLAKKNGQTTL